ncbi:MAG TPA: response regulator [Reyranella sp.]|nr:response regulator [Reyranella sp.]
MADSCDVLVVDDDVMLGETIARSLSRNGIRTRAVHSGSSALKVLEKERPRVAVLDYELPDTTGPELAQKLHEALPDISILLMSGAIGHVDRKTLEQCGIKVFLNKPVPLAPLNQAVMRLLKTR